MKKATNAAAKKGRPKKREVPDKRTPTDESVQPPMGGGYFGGNGSRQRSRDFSERKLDPFNYHPDVAAIFGPMIESWPELVFADEAVLIFLAAAKKPATIAEAFSFPAKVRPLIQSLESKRQGMRDRAAALLAYAVEHATADEAEALFKSIVKLKRTAEELQPGGYGVINRSAWALLAYNHFINEAGREPAKPELMKYMIARREKYPDQPAPGANSEWTDLWKACGLTGLKNRKPPAKKVPKRKPRK